jgi:hypothetical protein
VLIAYQDNGNASYGTFVIVSPTGSIVVNETVFNSASTNYPTPTKLDNGNVLIAYQDGGNSYYGTFVIVSPTGSIVRNETVFNSANTSYISLTKLDNGNVLIAYRDNGNSDYGTIEIIQTGVVPKYTCTIPTQASAPTSAKVLDRSITATEASDVYDNVNDKFVKTYSTIEQEGRAMKYKIKANGGVEVTKLSIPMSKKP